ncbi:MAG: hypothetical protein M3335_06130 [Actinomycetota bacterium]|nr:hypothetical protein [Actinomycetota bacterium]
MRLGRLSILFIAVLALALPASAGAAVVVGSNLKEAPNATICSQPGMPELDCTTTLTDLPVGSREPGGTSAPSSGVITSWSIRSGVSVISHKVRLRVIRNHTGAGSGPVETLPNVAGIYTYAARIPVQANDRIGVDTLDVPELKGAPIIRASATGAGINYWMVALADGETRNPTTSSSSIELTINATIEPDADGDGFGDETQDLCPSVGNGGAACPPTGGGGTGGGGGSTPPPPPVEVAPETKIAKGPKGTIGVPRATFRFGATLAGSRFQCKLDKKPFRGCKSPKVYKNLAAGKHTFKVRAIGPTGLVDPTPAKRTFKVAP